MNREQAENLIAAYVFDELDEPLRSELAAYLKTDAELAERVGDMRLTAKLLREGIAAQGPPKLSDHRQAALVQRSAGKPWRHRVLRLGGRESLRHAGVLAACLMLAISLAAMLFDRGVVVWSVADIDFSGGFEYGFDHESPSAPPAAANGYTDYATRTDGTPPDDYWQAPTTPRADEPRYYRIPDTAASRVAEARERAGSQFGSVTTTRPAADPPAPSPQFASISGQIPDGYTQTIRDYYKTLGQPAPDEEAGARSNTTLGVDFGVYGDFSPGEDRTPLAIVDGIRVAPESASISLGAGVTSEADEAHASELRPGNARVHDELDAVWHAGGKSEAQTTYDEKLALAQKKLADRDYAGAQDLLESAKSTLDRNQQLFSTNQYRAQRAAAEQAAEQVQSQRDLATAQSIREARDIETQTAFTARAESRVRTAGEVNALLHQANELRRDGDYARAGELTDQALFLEPNNLAAQAMKEITEDAQVIVERRKIDRLKALESAQLSNRNDEATIPYDDLMTYPADWPQITATRLADLTEDGRVEEAPAREVTRVYDIRDLAVEVPNFVEAPTFDLNEALSNDSSGGGGGGGGALFGSDDDGDDIRERELPRPGTSVPMTPAPAPEPAPEREPAAVSGKLADARWSDERGPTPEPEPLPVIQQQQAQQQVQQALDQEIAVSDPTELLHAAERFRQASDLHAAQDMMDRAAAYLPEEKRPQRSGRHQMIRQIEELVESERDAELDSKAANALAEGLAILDKKLELADRAMPQREQLDRMANQMEPWDVAAFEKPPEPVLRPGDALALSVFDANDLNKEQAWRAEVDADGWIAVPGRGRLNVDGLTPSQVGSAVAEAKADEFAAGLEPVPDAAGFDTTLQITPPKAAVILLSDGHDEPERMLEEIEQLAERVPVEVVAKPKLMPVNPWVMTEQDRLSTFALDVDTASYAIARRHIADGQLPPRHTVRMEEFVNAFDYQYPSGRDAERAFSVHAEAGPAPFAADPTTVLLKVGVRGKVIGRDQAKPAHLVFVLDTSGSMERDDRLPLLQRSLGLLLDQLAEHDRVSVVTYGERARLLVANAPATAKAEIVDTLQRLQTGGSTNLAAGVGLGHQLAQRHFLTGGVNRVILCSDGVANVGPDEAKTLVDQVAQLRGQGVTFTSIGVGTDAGGGAYDDRILEDLANKGDGTYYFLGSDADARRLFVEDLAATRPTIAFDAKIQVDFDPDRVRRYRLIGYENRDIADADFRNDAVDAGEVGSGQSATALYELELHGPPTPRADAGDLGTVYVRYRDAQTQEVQETQTRLSRDLIAARTPSADPRFFLAAAAAHVAEALRGSDHVNDRDTERNLQQAQRVLEEVSIALPLDARVRELLEITRRAQGLPRAP